MLPPSVQEGLPEAHLARYLVEGVERLDLSALERAYAGKGSDAYPPERLLSLLIYGYATGTFSRRKIERATYDSRAFRYIACHRHPDHDTLATFRKRFGTVSLDGTKVHANASRHSALSYAHAEKIEAQLKLEVQELMALANAADPSSVPDGVKLPDEIKRREDRLAAIAEAKAKIEARAQERFLHEQAEYEAKVAARAQKETATGKKSRGREPKPPEEGPRAGDQVNLTDEESRIIGGFEQSDNAQAGVDPESMWILATRVTQATHDKDQIVPMVEKVQANPEGLNHPETLLADTGFFSEKKVTACRRAGIKPLIAVKRDEHPPDWRERFTDITPVEAMKHALKTRIGRAAYALRKQTVEPVFGIIKSVMGFRQFLLRGLDNVSNEWTRVCLAWNLKRMAVLRPQ